MLGIEGKRGRGQQRMRWLDSIPDSIDMNLTKLWVKGKDREAWHASRWSDKKSDMTEQLSNNYNSRPNRDPIYL